MRVQSFDFRLYWLHFLIDVKVLALSGCYTAHFLVFSYHFGVTFLAFIDLGFELALLLDQLLFFVPLVLDAVVDLVTPHLVTLEEGRVHPVLVAKVLARSRHDWLESALLHLLEFFIELGLQALGLHCLISG